MSQFDTHDFLFHLSVVILVTSATAAAKPNPNYLLSCGESKKESDADGRMWVPDARFLSSTKNSVSLQAQSQDPLLHSTVPYMSARVFTAESTYRFSVPKKSRFWVRLHFYPANYSSLASTDSFMDVTVNGFTLLRNFSTAITCLALTQSYIIREFSLVATDSGRVTITFTPSRTHNGAYAFVNGIEVIPTPDIFQDPVLMVGLSMQQSVTFDTAAFQTMYRLNVGGAYISPSNDSGLTRTWYDDTPYVFGGTGGVTNEASKPIHYGESIPAYYAPIDVYKTARTMGHESKMNIQYNLTWVFNVDANFTYLVRFHFCDYLDQVMNQRVFYIYLNDHMAEEMADIIGWTGSSGRPIFVNYGLFVHQEVRDDNLRVALHPSTLNDPEFFDAMLNGLEVFKVSDGGGNLAGPNPQPSEMLARHEAEMMRSFAPTPWYSWTITTSQVIGGVAGALAGMAIVVLSILFIRHRKANGRSNPRAWLPVKGTSSNSSSLLSSKSNESGQFSDLASSLCRHFSLLEIRQATNNFNDSRVIGVGGFGKVYKGVVDRGMKVAIKRSNPSSEQGVHEFQTEIEMLSKLRHKHLVSLIGFCKENGEMILVYDYMRNGTMREHLYGSNNPPLPWKQRLEICIGAARGLHYLHTGANQTIIHRDVKTTNILLDKKWVAKVSDFGLSKMGPNLGQTHVSTMVKGSFGYLDPDYFRRQQLTDKSDVYSFGVVLFEALSGKPALNATLPKDQVSLADWARACIRNGTLDEIVDPILKGEINPECFQKFVEIAGKCLSEQGFGRPTMGDVLWNLEFALQLQENRGGTKLKTKASSVDPYHDMTSISISDDESDRGEDS